MERTNRGFASSAAPRRPRPEAGPVGPRRDDPLNPRSRRVNRSLRAAEFADFARKVRADLDPRGPLERLVARHVVRSAWRLKVNLEGHEAIDATVEGADVDRAARALEVAVTTLDLLQGRHAPEPVAEPAPAAAPPAPAGRPRPAAEADADDDEPVWRGRLVYDFDVSDLSPVVRGTWITVSHVVSLIVDGATWADILRTHPELTEVDIRACVAYAIAEDGSAL